MYTTCLFCHADLGRNEAIEAFPVGRRLAYDQARGRLWVVCRRCERWNLTPLEERWEAMEQAERAYRGTRLRAASDNVGLARLGDGTELVRIGRPLRPEFAAWRYGDQFGRRRRRRLLVAGGVAAAAGVFVVAGPVMGLFSLGGLGQLPNLLNAANLARRVRKRIVLTDAEAGAPPVRVSLVGAERTRLLPTGPGGFELVVPTFPRLRFDRAQVGRWTEQPTYVTFHGEAAVRAAGRLLPYVNRGGGGRDEVRAAVGLLDESGGAGRVFSSVAAHGRRFESSFAWVGLGHGRLQSQALGGLTAVARLALEMAAHEDHERRALEGELRELEAEWQQAEEVAAIADDLLLPAGVGERLGQLRTRSSARVGAPSSPTKGSGAASNS